MPRGKKVSIQPNNGVTEKHASALIASFKMFLQSVVAEQLGQQPIAVGNSDSVSTLTMSEDAVVGEDYMIGYRVVQAVCARLIDPKRVALRDNANYKAIVLDNNSHKPIVRLHFNGKKTKFIVVFRGKNGKKHPIEDLTDIYKCTKDIELRIKELSALKI